MNIKTPEPVTKYEHPDFVGGMIWTDQEVRWINARDAKFLEIIVDLRNQIDHIKQVEFPNKVDRVVQSWKVKVNALEKQAESNRLEISALRKYLSMCSDMLPGDDPLINKIEALSKQHLPNSVCQEHDWDCNTETCKICGYDCWST